MLYDILKTLSYLLAKILFRMQVRGRENLPAKGGFIVAVNHLSNLDPVLVGCSCPRRLFYLAKEELFENKIFGAFLNKINVRPLKRNSGDLSALKLAIKLLKQGNGLLMFPQGRRQEQDCSFEAVKAGVGFLAEKSGVPVVTAYIQGTNKALPRGAKVISPAKVRVIFGDKFYPQEGQSHEEFALKVMESIKELSHKMQSC